MESFLSPSASSVRHASIDDLDEFVQTIEPTLAVSFKPYFINVNQGTELFGCEFVDRNIGKTAKDEELNTWLANDLELGEVIEEPKGIVLILHGAVEHSLWYDRVAKNLISDNFRVFSHDHRGHGQSDGVPLDIDSFTTYISDLMAHVLVIKQNLATSAREIPIYLLGFSMGATMAIHASSYFPSYFDGLILLAPAIQPNLPINNKAFAKLMMKAGNFLAKRNPEKSMGKIGYAKMFRSSDVIQRWKTDQLISSHGDAIKARQGMETMHAMESIRVGNYPVKCPFLVLHGSKDSVARCSGSASFYKQSSVHDKTLILYPKSLHALHHETDETGDQILHEINEWLLQHVPFPN